MLSIAVHLKTVKKFSLAEHTRKICQTYALCAQKNRFLVCSVCDKIVSAYAQHTHAIIFKNYSKSHIKMQISTIINPNFEKLFRNPSNRTQVNIQKKKKFVGYLSKKIYVPRMLSHRGNVRSSKFWPKSKEKKRKFTKAV